MRFSRLPSSQKGVISWRRVAFCGKRGKLSGRYDGNRLPLLKGLAALFMIFHGNTLLVFVLHNSRRAICGSAALLRMVPVQFG